MAHETLGSPEHIVTDSTTHGGCATIRDTHVSVEQVLRCLMVTLDIDGVLDTFPALTRDDLRAVLAYAYTRLYTGDDQMAEVVGDPGSMPPWAFYQEMVQRPDVSELLRRLAR